MLDYRDTQFRQAAPLKIDVTAELLGGEIRIHGHLATRLETSCDRCLGAVEIPVSRDFDLFYRPLETIAKEVEVEIPADELEIGFYSGAHEGGLPARMPGSVSRVRGESESCIVRLFALAGRFPLCFARGRVVPGWLGGVLPTRAVLVENPAARGDCLAGSSGGSPRSIPYRRKEEQSCRIPNDDIPKRGKIAGGRTII
jgi:hypothetical protein